MKSPKTSMKLSPYFTYSWAMLLVLTLAACGGAQGDGSQAGAVKDAPASETGLTQEQLEKGIGPVQHVTLTDQIDQTLASKGEEIFNMKCAACHKMDQRYVGPPLGDVVARRTPEFVMNMILNTSEMIEKHPTVKELLAQYMTPMPNQSLTEEDARAVLEYLRSQPVATAAR